MKTKSRTNVKSDRLHGSPTSGKQTASSLVTHRGGGSSRKETDLKGLRMIVRREAYGLIPVVLAVLTSINALSNGFAFDDTQQVLNNDFIRTLGNLPLAFSTNVWAFLGEELMAAQDVYFRPLFTALFMVDYSIFGLAAWGWHLVNVLIHAAATFFVFLVCRELTTHKWVALVAAALFAVHPAHSESVAWVSGVTDPLMALFALPSFYFYLRYRKEAQKYFLAAALGLFWLALLCKETAIVLPAMVAYCELAVFRELSPLRQRIFRAAILLAVFAVPTAVYLLMRYNAVKSTVALFETRYSLGLTLKTVPTVTVKYLKLMFVPMGYSIQHFTAPVTSILNPAFVWPVILLLSVIAAILLIRSRTLTFAALWFIVWLAPPISSIRIFDPLYYVQERYLYLPSVGICLAVALGIDRLARQRLIEASFGRVVTTALVGIMIVSLSLVTIEQNTAWHDTITLHKHSVAADPRAPLARTALAGAYFEAGKTREAEAEAHTALDLDPTCIDAYLVLSVFAHASGKIDEAIKYLERAESMVPEGPQKRGYVGKIYSKLAFLYNQRKNYALAEEYLCRQVALIPYLKSWLDLGDFYFDRGRYQEALEMFAQVTGQVNPKFAPIHLKLARTHDRLGMHDLARIEYKQYLDLAPTGAQGRAEASRWLLNH